MNESRAVRRYVLAITTLASFLTPFMVSSINLAVPNISADLGADAVALNWVALVYLLATAALMVPFGRLADLYGRRKVFLAGLVVYGLASALAAVVGSVELLIVFRAGQGIGGAMVSATAVAILTASFPPDQRGRVLGINSAAVYTGLSMGPVLGGFLTQQVGWRSIFVLNAVAVAMIVPLALAKLRREWAEAAGQSFDWGGAALYVVALVAFMYGVSSLYEVAYARWLALGGALGLGLFVWVELRVPRPILDLRRFHGNRLFIFSNLTALIQYVATFAVTFMLSLYLQVVQGVSPQRAGLILLAQPVMMAVLSPLSGWLSDRLEPRLISSIGMVLTGGTLGVFSFFDATTPVGLVLGMQAVMGFGFALFSSPNTNALMGAVSRRDYGVAASVLGTMRSVGQAFSMAVLLLLFTIYVGRVEVSAGVVAQYPQIRQELLTVMQVGFRWFAALSLVGLVASVLRGRLHRARPGGGEA